mgnify:CR=1 FL=1
MAPSSRARSNRDDERAVWAVPAVIVAIMLSGFVVVWADWWFVTSANTFADAFPMTNVSSKEDLRKLGPSAATVSWVAFVTVPLALLASLGSLIPERTRRWAWIAPLAGAAIIVLAALIGAALFQPPAPDAFGTG